MHSYMYIVYLLCDTFFLTFFTFFPLTLLPNGRVVACIRNGPAWNPLFDNEHVCNKFFWGYGGSGFWSSENGKAYPDNLTFKGAKKTWTPSCGPGCMYASSHAVSHTTGLSHRASTQIKVERPLLVGEKTCYIALLPSNCTDHHKKKGPFLENCNFM